MSAALDLGVPDFALAFFLETDASKNGIGIIFMQCGHPLAYISKPHGPKTQGLSTDEKEHMTIIFAIEQWRFYLQHSEFIIYTDKKSLIHLNE